MEFVQITAAIIGTLSIFLGYKLFCEVPRPLLVASGALLAVFGVALLSADFSSIRHHSVTGTQPALQHARPTGVDRHKTVTDWFV